jgi:Mg-chelatase subunit ChlD
MTKFFLVESAKTTLTASEQIARESAIQSASRNVIAETPRGTFVEIDEASAAQLAAAGFDLVEFPDPGSVSIAGHVVDLQTGRDLQRVLPVAARGWPQYVVVFVAPPENDWVRALERGGLRITGKLGTYGFMVEGDSNDVAQIVGSPHIAFVAAYQPKWRISPYVARLNGRIEFASIKVSPPDAADAVADVIRRQGGRVERIREPGESPSRNTRVIIAEIDAAELTRLSEQPDVRWIDYQPPTYKPEDERSSQIVCGNLNTSSTIPVKGYADALADLGFDGSGVIIAIADTGVDTNTTATTHDDLAGRFAFGPTTPGDGDKNGHGTHVAGIAVGNAKTGDTDANGFRLGQGVAPGSQYGVIISTGAPSIEDFFNDAVQKSAPIINISMSVNAPGQAYTDNDIKIDVAVRGVDGALVEMQQQLTVVLSAGNNPDDPLTLNWLTKQTKNGIVVGASNNYRPEFLAVDDICGVWTDSARGPAADNRLLPTVCAPGVCIVSARSNADESAGLDYQRADTPYEVTKHENHTIKSGTSQAAPHVSGLCALLIEWWRDRTGDQTPSPAMLKALIVNGAVDCGGGSDGNGGKLGPIPNPQQGWGRANLRNIVLAKPDVERGPKIFVDQSHVFRGNDQFFTRRVAVIEPKIPLRITLAWTDAPGAEASDKTLVNDLDLEVKSVTKGTLFLGEGGSGSCFAKGFSVTKGTRDDLNNLECVYIEGPKDGDQYDVTVRARSVTIDARPPNDSDAWQDFALVIDNAELVAVNPVNIVTLIDGSSSMTESGYVDVTRTLASAFTDRLRAGDSFGVVSFGSGAQQVYPTSGGVVSVNGTEREQAGKAIADIRFEGMTHIGPAITMGAAMLTDVVGRRGMALFSDGYDNGTPTAPTAVADLSEGLPIYTCAMGLLSDQRLLEQIATTTGGRYYFMPTADDLFEIHNYMSGSLTDDSLVVNESAVASSSRVEAWIDSTCSRATFCVTWANRELDFQAEAPSTVNDIAVRLRAPNGKLVHPHAAYVHCSHGPGYVVFRVDEPAVGRWYMEVSTMRDDHTRYTAAAFVDSSLRLRVDATASRVELRQPWQASVAVLGIDHMLPDLRVVGTLTCPAFDIEDILRRHDEIQVDEISDVIPADIAKLAAIQAHYKRLEQPDPFVRTSSDLSWQLADPQLDPSEGLASARHVPRFAGSHNAYISISGTVPGTGETFVRRQMVSFLAE